MGGGGRGLKVYTWSNIMCELNNRGDHFVISAAVPIQPLDRQTRQSEISHGKFMLGLQNQIEGV